MPCYNLTLWMLIIGSGMGDLSSHQLVFTTWCTHTVCDVKYSRWSNQWRLMGRKVTRRSTVLTWFSAWLLYESVRPQRKSNVVRIFMRLSWVLKHTLHNTLYKIKYSPGVYCLYSMFAWLRIKDVPAQCGLLSFTGLQMLLWLLPSGGSLCVLVVQPTAACM